MPDIDDNKLREEIMNLHTAIYEKTGYEMKYIRPPKGEFNERTLKKSLELGYKTVMWSFAYMDWDEKKQPTKEQAMEKLTKRIHPGAIVLLHSTSSTNGEILGDLINEWKKMGYTFGELTEL